MPSGRTYAGRNMKRHVPGVRRGEAPPCNGIAIGRNFNPLVVSGHDEWRKR